MRYAAGYLLLMTMFLYGVVDRDASNWTNWLLLLVVLLQPAVGLAIGRWWAVVLPALVVLIAVPAGYPEITDNAEPLPIWFGAMFGAAFAVPLVALGVGWRKIRDRRRALTPAFVVHALVGVGTVVALLSFDALRDNASFFLWIVGVPWVAGFVAFFGWPRASSGLAWVLPAVPLMLGVAALLMVEASAGIG